MRQLTSCLVEIGNRSKQDPPRVVGLADEHHQHCDEAWQPWAPLTNF